MKGWNFSYKLPEYYQLGLQQYQLLYDSFQNKIYGITGDPKKIFVLSKSWGVLSEKIFTEDGNYLINHSSSVMLLENGKYLDRINHHANYKDMYKVINKYLR